MQTEFIDLTEIEGFWNGDAPERVDTNDIRADGGLAFYQPISELGQDHSFTLQYDNGGEFASGEDADGDRGIAAYRFDQNGWTCRWTHDDKQIDGITRCCALLASGVARELELVARIKRDRVFRKMILKADGQACAETGETNPWVLDAAHVVEVRDEGSDTADNGVTLRKDSHALFDARLLTFDLEESSLSKLRWENSTRNYSATSRVCVQRRCFALDKIFLNETIRSKVP